MDRIKIDLPDKFSFSAKIPVRITDLNYGGHVGNDSVLSLIHEARMQFFAQWGYSEMNMAGIGMIMSDAGIEFKNELFYGDTVIVSVTAGHIQKASFALYYKLEKEEKGLLKTVAAARTGMVCYDYEKKRIAPVPEEAANVLRGI